MTGRFISWQRSQRMKCITALRAGERAEKQEDYANAREHFADLMALAEQWHDLMDEMHARQCEAEYEAEREHQRLESLPSIFY